MKEDLLKKPPPKFIYDIIMNTLEVTGFPKGLFTEEESTPGYFDTKVAQKKVDFLQKTIDITMIITKEKLDIKVTNICKNLFLIFV